MWQQNLFISTSDSSCAGVIGSSPSSYTTVIAHLATHGSSGPRSTRCIFSPAFSWTFAHTAACGMAPCRPLMSHSWCIFLNLVMNFYIYLSLEIVINGLLLCWPSGASLPRFRVCVIFIVLFTTTCSISPRDDNMSGLIMFFFSLSYPDSALQ